MNNALRSYTDVEVCANITYTAQGIPHMKTDGVRNDYYIPNSYLKRNGTPKEEAINYVSEIIQRERPDLIHIWGTEKGWGLMISNHYKESIPCLLEIQGLSFFVAEERFYGGISNHVIRKMRGLVEFIYPQSRLEAVKKKMQQWGEIEIPMIQSYRFVNTQSEWVRQLIYWISKDVMTYKTGIILRDSFMKSPLWSSVHKRAKTPVLFTTTSPIPYKGLHTTLKAFSLVLKEFPTACLRVAGVGVHNVLWKDNGYIKYLRKECVRLNIENNVHFLGKLDEKRLMTEMYNADVFVISSYVESYCLALAEALSLGMPCVAPFTSAITELIDNEVNGLLYPQSDYYVYAYKIITLLRDENKTEVLGNKASVIQRKKSDSYILSNNQVRIYNDILCKFHEKKNTVI